MTAEDERAFGEATNSKSGDETGGRAPSAVRTSDSRTQDLSPMVDQTRRRTSVLSAPLAAGARPVTRNRRRTWPIEEPERFPTLARPHAPGTRTAHCGRNEAMRESQGERWGGGLLGPMVAARRIQIQSHQVRCSPFVSAILTSPCCLCQPCRLLREDP